jgi:hypothetical protein
MSISGTSRGDDPQQNYWQAMRLSELRFAKRVRLPDLLS